MRAIIEGKGANKGRPSAKGKFWELRTTTTKPPGVTLVDIVLYEELSENNRARDDKQKSAKETKPKEGPMDRKPTHPK